MRDAFGGVFMIRLMLVILFIYVSFTALSLTYAKAFRIKNAIIDIVEKSSLQSLKNLDNDFITKLDNSIDKFNYNKTCNTEGEIISDTKTIGYCYRGILISIENTDDKYIYYKVTTVADWNIGTLSNLLSFNQTASKGIDGSIKGAWKISGTAKVAKNK